MKIRTLINCSVLSGLLLFLPGCLDIYLTTQLFPNGEIEKTVVIKGDSTDIPGAPFFFMKDTSWTRKWVDGDEKDKKNLVLTRRFKSVDDLNEIMNPEDTTIQTIRVRANLKRKFRWFFTYFDYSETVLKADPFKTRDWREFLTDEELRLIKIDDEDQRKADPGYDEQVYKLTDKKYEQFLIRSVFDCYINTLSSGIRDDPDFLTLKGEIESRRDDLYNYLVDSAKAEDSENLLIAMDKFFNEDKFTALIEKNPEPFDLFDRKMEFWSDISANSYKFIIRMPGLLMETSSTQVQGTENRWELKSDDFYFDEYSMSCESRVINKWAFWVAGIILVLAILLVINGLRKR